MAEARAAVSYAAHKRGIGYFMNEDGIEVTLFIPSYHKLRRKFVKSSYRLWNGITNMLHPAPAWVLAIIVAGVVSLVLSSEEDSIWRGGFVAMLVTIDSYLPWSPWFSESIRLGFFATQATLLTLLTILYAQRLALRVLFSYQGWMYISPKQRNSLPLLLWGFAVKMLMGRGKPLTFAYQKVLPRLPVPSVHQTLTRYVESVRAFQGGEKFSETKRRAEEFERTSAGRLQKLLLAKSWVSGNYVSDWWEKYVYLRGRTPTMINSNYYVLASPVLHKMSGATQCARAAAFVYSCMRIRRLLIHERIEPQLINNMIPICMAQHERLFGCTRIPGREQDTLQVLPFSEHVTVMCKGSYYRVYGAHRNGEPLTLAELEHQIKRIQEDAAEHAKTLSASERNLACLTAANRTKWAEVREDYFSQGVNKVSLDIIESSMFVLVLDDTKPSDGSDWGRSLMHGDGSTRWFDKSFCAVCFADGRVGLNVEHSWADAPVIGHLMEFILVYEWNEKQFDAQGNAVTSPKDDFTRLSIPKRLQWTLPPVLSTEIDSCFKDAQALIADLDLMIVCFRDYGKGYIKSCGVSPDAFLQAALQLAYYKNTGQFTLTYEASMTRLFREGRTETVRSCTPQICAFVMAMVKRDKPREEIIALLKQAADVHTQLYKDAMTGKGIDRHLFALYVASIAMGVESPFLNEAVRMPWKLSTSQQPQLQTEEMRTTFKRLQETTTEYHADDLYMMGGGFGPVADDGYGVSYMIPGENQFYFHVSSKKSSKETSSQKFVNDLFSSLQEMKELFQSPPSDK